MPATTDDDSRPNARLTTPLPEGVLLLRTFEGTEQLSRLFQFKIELYSPNNKKKDVLFEKILGNDFVVECDIYDRVKEKRTGKYRYFHGICFEFTEGLQDSDFTKYTALIVPKIELLTLERRCRIFQQKSVPDILKEVLPKSGVEFQLTGDFKKREYCVQYRESDFDFASRLMEEEGIFYFFRHEKTAHTMVVANSSLKHPKVMLPDTVDLDPSEGASRRGGHLSDWSKVQRVKSGKYTLWDHHFQLPNSNLEGMKTTQEQTRVGKVDHQLKVAGNDSLEIYDYPGGYARRADGVNKSGSDQASELQNVNSDSVRTAKLRMEGETIEAILIHGSSNCVNFVAGYTFTLEESDSTKGFGGDGDYVLTEVKHNAQADIDHRTGEGKQFSYSNKIVCVPQQTEYRPQRTTPVPTVMGVQCATVVGPAGEEIFTDKYGRVKVQFRWDRDGKNDANSSCWLRVTTLWAGKQWGMVHIPRIGQEVLVDFVEGHPDAPIIIGSVYNPNTMPPYALPDNKTQSGIKSRSSKGGSPENFNEIRFEDKKGSEMLTIHAELDEEIEVERDKKEKVGHDQSVNIINNDTLQVGMQQSVTVGTSHSTNIGTTRSVTIGASETLNVGATRSTTIAAADSLTAGGPVSVSTGAAFTVSAGGVISMSSGGAITVTAGAAITITASAAIAITAPAITLNGRPVLPIPAPI